MQILVSDMLSWGATINLLKVVITFSRHVKDLLFCSVTNILAMARLSMSLLLNLSGTSTVTMAKWKKDDIDNNEFSYSFDRVLFYFVNGLFSSIHNPSFHFTVSSLLIFSGSMLLLLSYIWKIAVSYVLLVLEVLSFHQYAIFYTIPILYVRVQIKFV